MIAIYHQFNNKQQAGLTESWTREAMRTREELIRPFCKPKKKKDHNHCVVSSGSQVGDVVRVGLRVHGAGAWNNLMLHTVVNAVALGREGTLPRHPTLNVIRLPPTTQRCCGREGQLQRHIRQMPACPLDRARNASPSQCWYSTQPAVAGRPAGFPPEELPIDWKRYEHGILDATRKVDYRTTTGPGARGEAGDPQNTVAREMLGRLMLALWHDAVANVSTTSLGVDDARTDAGPFAEWCGSIESGFRSPLVTLTGTVKEGMHLCTPTISRLLKPLIRASRTAFIDAAALRSLHPFPGNSDEVHDDCSSVMPSTNPQTGGQNHFPHMFRALPFMFNPPSVVSPDSLTAISRPLCKGRESDNDFDGAALATILLARFTADFVKVDRLRLGEHPMRPVLVPAVMTSDHCRSTFQRSELSVLFGELVSDDEP